MKTFFSNQLSAINKLVSLQILQWWESHFFFYLIIKLPEKMEGDNTLLYIIAFVIIAHFAVGFIFLAKKLSGPTKEED